MKYFEKVAETEIRKKFRNAEKALVRLQKQKIKKDSTIGSIIGAGMGTGLGGYFGGATSFKSKLISGLVGAAAGAPVGATAGVVSGVVRSSRGKDAANIRKKYFGTTDTDKILKLQNKHFKNLNDYYNK